VFWILVIKQKSQNSNVKCQTQILNAKTKKI